MEESAKGKEVAAPKLSMYKPGIPYLAKLKKDQLEEQFNKIFEYVQDLAH